jgi:fatty acid desaturase
MKSATTDCGERNANLGGFVVDRKKYLRAVRELSRVSNLRGALSIARQWLIIIAIIWAAISIGQLWFYLLAGVLMASRQHALGVIMHDATHYRLFTNRNANEWVSNFLCAFPLGLSTELYRRQHLEHHQFTNTDLDPYFVAFRHDEDWQWPKDQIESAKVLAMDLFGLHLHKWFLTLFQWSPLSDAIARHVRLPASERVCFLVFACGTGVLIGATGSLWLFLGLWVLPAVTVLGFFFRIRTVAEHMALSCTDELNSTRHVDGTLVERFFFAPLNINYHVAHHLFPSVPHYNLPRLHDILLEDPDVKNRIESCKTYLGFGEGVLSKVVRW